MIIAVLPMPVEKLKIGCFFKKVPFSNQEIKKNRDLVVNVNVNGRSADPASTIWNQGRPP